MDASLVAILSACLRDVDGLQRDRQLLVCRNNHHRRARVAARLHLPQLGAARILLVVDLDAKLAEASANAAAQVVIVFSDARRKDDRVNLAVQIDEIGAEVLADSLDKELSRESRCFVTTIRRLPDGSHVVLSEEAEEARLLVKDGVDIGRRVAERAEKREDRRVDVAAPGAHDEALEWRHAHARVDADAALDARDAGAVAQVHHNGVQLGFRLFQLSRDRVHHEVVRRAMEAVLAHTMLAVDRIRQCVPVRLWRHSRVEGRVEDGNMRCATERLTRLTDAQQV
mmetsp:Transcript_16274/g.34899  ORF Transcript_16274/g.34899 Transcript_16274/m.34899 type:complete len:284 (-) Transcript_16274:435-1286(-)